MGLEGGYGIPFDPSPLLAALQDAPHDGRLWDTLIEGLYHQGDVGEASCAAVSGLVKIGPTEEPPPWQLLVLVAMIELARSDPRNPPLPSWLEREYGEAIKSLALRSLRTIDEANTLEQLRGMLCVLALWKGLRTYSAALLEYSEEELKQLLPQ
jgi:hypothetical protein